MHQLLQVLTVRGTVEIEGIYFSHIEFWSPPARSTDFRAELGAPRATREDLLNGPPIQPAAEQIQIQLISQRSLKKPRGHPG